MVKIILHMELYNRMRGTNYHKRSVGLLLGVRDMEKVYVRSFLPFYGKEHINRYLQENLHKKEIVGYGIVRNTNDQSMCLGERIATLNRIVYPSLISGNYAQNRQEGFFRNLIVIGILNYQKHVVNKGYRISTQIKGIRLKFEKYYFSSLQENFDKVTKLEEIRTFSELIGTRKPPKEFIEKTVTIFGMTVYKDDVELTIIPGKLANFRSSTDENRKMEIKMSDEGNEEELEKEDEGEGEMDDEEEEENENIKRKYDSEQRSFLEKKIGEFPIICNELEETIDREIIQNKQLVETYRKEYNDNLNLMRYLEYLTDLKTKTEKTRPRTPPPPLPPPSNTNTNTDINSNQKPPGGSGKDLENPISVDD